MRTASSVLPGYIEAFALLLQKGETAKKYVYVK